MDMVNYGIIGCGMMAHEHIQNIALLPHGRVSVVFDPVRELAEAAAELAGHCGAAPAHIADTLEDLLAHADLDAVVIVSPNHIHAEQLRQIVATRPLPILCEKPLYTDPSDKAELISLFEEYPHPVWIAMEYRYMPPVAALIEQAESATGGIAMLTIREHRFPFLPKIGDWNRFNENTGGTLVEKCCHFFDLMRLILKAEPVRVMASAGQTLNHKDETYDGRVPDIWDNGYVIVDFDNGSRAMLELCMFAEGAQYQEEISAVGPKGKIECRVPGPGRFWPTDLGPAPIPQLIVSPRAPKGPTLVEIPVDPTLLEAGDHNGSTFYQHQRFNAVVRGQGAVEVTVSDGAKAVAMGIAAQESAKTGQAVDL
ncbi:Gfo/Idh/MocA family oxidoreductase [Octadecabacter sp. 1_MG-2023]|uniref:Gfo/Idh/MocA family protein n=1 Tax=unclassified Octadecabacter TaxID=196158 RepID=UPI001C092E3B|nr:MULTISPECIES: Gfo/Idh/MocA family oxidoreductase [unclassified Octadecabacter]MBU2993077.1 Gfo/Idh/MocA family oxidoreductase [Octadecabacter sp. B2R22]MDO6733471.1 Gfo/Idh/MocA family oxidoreductase [Octadecabacter sp. 1_MG-2023]